MTIGAYEALYESTIAYGIRKALMAEQMKTELEAKINQLNGTKRELNEQVENLKKTIDNTISRANEKRAQEEKAHNDEVRLCVEFVILKGSEYDHLCRPLRLRESKKQMNSCDRVWRRCLQPLRNNCDQLGVGNLLLRRLICCFNATI